MKQTNIRKAFRKKLYLFLGIFVILFFLIFSPTIHLKLGNMFFGNVPSLYNLTLAQFFFTRATNPLIGTPPQNAYYQLSRTSFISGDISRAVIYAHKELELYPENIRTYYILGLTYGYMNREQDAITAFAKFIERNPMTWAARNDKAWLEFRIGDIDAALATIRPVSHDTTNAWIQNTYGTLLLNKGKYSEAQQAFLAAQRAAENMTEESWGTAYPGNDPRIYQTGLSATRQSIKSNLLLVEQKLMATP